METKKYYIVKKRKINMECDSGTIHLDFTQHVSLFLEQHQLKIDGEIWELLW